MTIKNLHRFKGKADLRPFFPKANFRITDFEINSIEPVPKPYGFSTGYGVSQS
jgi:hypothetical protein